MHQKQIAIAFFVAVLGSTAGFESEAVADWLRFRGPNGSGISAETAATPVTWTPESVKWKVELPGPGSSCPIVVGDKVLVTCWSGYGIMREFPGEQSDLRRHLVCYDREQGKELWRTAVEAVLPEDEYSGMFAEHGYASHTPVSDGEHVFAFFGKSGVVAFDLNGKKLWQSSVGTGLGARSWGSSASPLLFKDLVIVPATAESESIVALEKATGKQRWVSKSSGYNSTWGSPILVETEKQTDLVIAVPNEIWGLNPDTGKLTWYAEALAASSLCSSCIADEDGVVYAFESSRGEGGGIAIRAGGKKDVSESQFVWYTDQSSRIVTPLISNGRIYACSNRIFTCLDAKTGNELFKSRLRGSAAGQSGGRRGGQDYGSPVMANDRIYFTSRNGDTYVLQAGEKFSQLAVNRVTTEAEDFSATPAISDGAIFLRSDMHLYCVQ